MSVITSPMTRMGPTRWQAIFRTTLLPSPPMSPRRRYSAADPAADRAVLSSIRRCCKKSRLSLCNPPRPEFSAEGRWHARSRQHQRRAGLRVAEDQELGGRHFQPHPSRFSAVVDQGEELHAFRLQDRLEFIDRLVHGAMAWNFDNPCLFSGRRSLQREPLFAADKRPNRPGRRDDAAVGPHPPSG